MAIQIKNWAKFQHFKDRRPPWIKLYRDILDDPEWFELDPLAAKVLVMLWVMASEDHGTLPDIKRISFRLRLDINLISNLIIQLKHWLIYDDIDLISTRYQLDTPEGERETEAEGETETEAEGETEGKEACQIVCVASVKPTRPATKKKAAMSDQEWLQSLVDNPAYSHINVPVEFGKLVAWCEVKRKQPTRSRFLGWLNRIEKPIKGIAATTRQQPKTFDQIRQENNFKAAIDFAEDNHDGSGQKAICRPDGDAR